MTPREVASHFDPGAAAGGFADSTSAGVGFIAGATLIVLFAIAIAPAVYYLAFRGRKSDSSG